MCYISKTKTKVLNHKHVKTYIKAPIFCFIVITFSLICNELYHNFDQRWK